MKKGEVSKSLFLGYTNPADRSSKFLGNVGSHLPIQTASYPTRLESPPITLPEPHRSKGQNVLLSIAQAPLPFNSKVTFRVHKKSYHQGNNPVFNVFGHSDHIHHLQHKTDHTVNVPSVVMWGEWKPAAPQSRLPLNKYVPILGCVL